MTATAIVIDNGKTCKAGLAGDEMPSTVFPCITGTPRRNMGHLLTDKGQKEKYLGREAASERRFLNIRSPIENGHITNWDDMEKIWHYAIEKELQAVPEEHPILITDRPYHLNLSREKMAEVFFENFNTPSFYVSLSAELALHASGRTTGIVVQSGSEATHIVPIHQGRAIPDAYRQFTIAGDDLTDFLTKELTEQGYEIRTSTGSEIVRDIKEKLCFVSDDFEQSVLAAETSHFEKIYSLPDGQVIAVGAERFRCPECLFQPAILGLDEATLQARVYNCIMKSNVQIRNELFENIVLAGGNTIFPGFAERLQKEVALFLLKSRTLGLSHLPIDNFPPGLMDLCLLHIHHFNRGRFPGRSMTTLVLLLFNERLVYRNEYIVMLKAHVAKYSSLFQQPSDVV